jgi:hypothetical protein
MESSFPCKICNETGHKTSKCPDIGPNAPPPSGGGGGGSHDEDDEKAVLKLVVTLFTNGVKL